MNTQDKHAIVESDNMICVATQQGGAEIMRGKCPTITAAAGLSGNNQPYCVDGTQKEALNPYEEFRLHCRVRRFDLTECERLQAMPDGWTQVHFTEEEITPDMIEFFRQIWYWWDKMNAETPEDAEKVKPRSDKKIISFLTGEMPDNARYKMLGNGICTPMWKWVLKRISAHYERDATMGSLFDGIGSFPYLWEQINGKGSCLWSSEVDPYPIKVTVYRL